MSSSARRHELDGLRAVAILLVLVHHSLNRWAPGGFVGVDLFFALSGYLITGLLLNEWEVRGTVSLRRFYLRRLLRLMPPLVVVVCVYLGLAVLLPGVDAVRSRGLGALTALAYLSNWVTALGVFKLGALEHTWSLATEEQFYLLWPPLLLLLLKAGSRRGLKITVALAIASTSCAWRLWLVHRGAPIERVYYGFDTRLEGLLLGCALALMPEAARSNRATSVFAYGGFAGLIYVVLRSSPRDEWMQGAGYALVALCSVAWLAGLLGAPGMGWQRWVLSTGPLRYLGRASYALYLWHQPVNFTVRAFPQLSSGMALILRLGGATVLAVLTHELLEKRMERIRHGLGAELKSRPCAGRRGDGLRGSEEKA